jgi:hypothetical protein
VAPLEWCGFILPTLGQRHDPRLGIHGRYDAGRDLRLEPFRLNILLGGANQAVQVGTFRIDSIRITDAEVAYTQVG